MADAVLGNEVFRQLAESAPDALAVHRNGVVIWANAAANALVAVEGPTGIVGRNIFEFVHPDERERLRGSLAASMAHQSRATYVTHFVTAQGAAFEAEVTRIPIGDERALVIVRNLERERLKRTAESRARAFFDASTVALGISRDGVHVEVNAAYARLFGFDDPAALVGRPILDLIAPSEHERIVEKVRQRTAGSASENEYDVLARRRDGSTFMMNVKVSTYVDGRDVLTIVGATDVTAQRAEAEQRAHRERLESIGRLAGGVAHDFNNLLAAILANTELSLLETKPNTAMHEQLNTVREAVRRAKDLVRQILTFGRRDQPRPQALAPVQVITDALTLARSGLSPGVTLRAALSPIEGSLLADPTQLHQIVLNLVSNARDAVTPTGLIEVSADALDGATLRPPQPGRWLRLRVRDDGVGMTEENRRHLFEPYHTTKAGRGGHGLGLAVVQGIVSALSGRIEVESATGRGATFDVFLPLAAAPGQVYLTPSPAQAGHGRVLLVDDEPVLLRTMGRLLRSLGYEVLEAAGGELALELLAREKIDLVFSDVTMPGVSGLDLARRVALEHPTVRILLCSGYSDGLDTVPPGVSAVLPKPLGRKEVALALTTALLERR